MKQTFTIPSIDVEYEVSDVNLNLETKTAIVNFRRTVVSTGEDLGMTHVSVNVVDLFQSDLVSAEITAFKKGLKSIIAGAWGRQLADITNDPLA